MNRLSARLFCCLLGLGLGLVADSAVLDAQQVSNLIGSNTRFNSPPSSPSAPSDSSATPPNPKASLCSACHGFQDHNYPLPGYPSLSGQHAKYLEEQTQLILSGQRHNALAVVMKRAVGLLTSQDIQTIAAWYAAQAPMKQATPGQSGTGTARWDVGRTLYQLGDAKRSLPACSACHGALGQGNPGPAYPRIGGQSRDYLIRRLTAYQHSEEHARDDANDRIMETIATRLSTDDIIALAEYLSNVKPERPVANSQPAVFSSK